MKEIPAMRTWSVPRLGQKKKADVAATRLLSQKILHG